MHRMRALFARAQDLGLAVLAFLACADASIISGKSHGKYSFTKEQRIPDAGVDAVRPICDPLVSECFSSDEQVQDELIIALEADGLTTGERGLYYGIPGLGTANQERTRPQLSVQIVTRIYFLHTTPNTPFR